MKKIIDLIAPSGAKKDEKLINYIRKKHPGMKIVYKKSEEFINELIAAISNGTTAEFKDSYRTADILLIDDISSSVTPSDLTRLIVLSVNDSPS